MKKKGKKSLALLLSASLLQGAIIPVWSLSLDATTIVDELTDFSATLEHSNGWEKVAETPQHFFNDDSRLIRTEDTAQYLIYQLDDLKDFKITMHSYLRNLRYVVNIYQSNDLNEWKKVDYTITSARTSDSAFWGTFDIMPLELLDGHNQYLKIEIKNNDKADQTTTVNGSKEVDFLKAVQIGKVELTNDDNGLLTNTNTNINEIMLRDFDNDVATPLKIGDYKNVELINPTLFDVKIESSNPKVVKYENNKITGIDNGTAYLKGIIPGQIEVFKYEIKVGTGVNKDISPTETSPTNDTGENPYISQANGNEIENIIHIDPENIVVKDYMGGAMELEMIEWFDMDDARWERYFQRIKYMDLGFVRCMLATYWYCTGFDDAGNPIYVWDCLNTDGTPKYYSRDGYPIDILGNNIEPNIKRMKRLYQLFDFFKENNITVMTGEWQYAEAAEWYYVPGEYLKQYDLNLDDPRYAQIVTDFIEHMVKDKKYTCITQYDLGNEVNINPGSYQYNAWKNGNINVYNKLKEKGLDSQVSLTPDLSYWSGLWYNESINDLHEIFKQYDFHWYVHEENLKNGVFENEMRLLVNNASQDDIHKKVYMGEVGMRDFLNSSDQVTNIDSFEYGLWMANILVQGTRAGMAGLTAWSLDDAVHINGPMTYDYSVDDKSLMKVWGLWNSLGEYQGVSEDIRPWYIPWSLASRFMPKGSQIVYTNPIEQQVYSTAAIYGDDITISVVNHSGKEQKVLVRVPEATQNVDLSIYAYFKNDINQDENGYPLRSGFKTDIDLKQGVVLTLPTNGNIILTTMESSHKLKSQDDGYLNDSMQSLQNTIDYKNIGFNSYEKHPNNAQSRIQMNKDLFGDVTRINRSSNEPSYLVYKKEQGIQNFRIHSYGKGGVINHIKVYGSNDQGNWEELNINETSKYTLASGWKFAVLTPQNEINYKYLKVELQNDIASTDIQIGKIELTNEKEFTQTLELEIPDTAQDGEYKETIETINTIVDEEINIYSIKSFENLPENFTLESANEDIVQITNNISFKVLKPGSTIVNIYQKEKIIGSIVVHVYTFHDEIKEGNGLVYQNNNMKYDHMADANDSTFSRQKDGASVVYKLKEIHDFSIKGYVADSNDKLFDCYKVYGSIDGLAWESIDVNITNIGALSNPYWHYGYIVPKETIQKDYEYLKIAIEGTLTDDWKVQFGDVRIQDKPFDSVITKVELANDKLELKANDSKNIQAKVLPEAVFPFEVKYEITDENIARVDENGVVTGIREGTTIVRVYAKDRPEIYAECHVTVQAIIDDSRNIADSINTLTITNNKVDIPTFDGFEVTIKYSDNTDIIDLQGNIKPSQKDEKVNLILSVKNLKTGVSSETNKIMLKIDRNVMNTVEIVVDDIIHIDSIKGFENLSSDCILKSSDENIVKIINKTSFKAINPGSALVNVYKSDKIIGTVIVHIYAFHDSIQEGNDKVYQINGMKYDLMAATNDSTFSRTQDGGYVIYKSQGVYNFMIKGYVATDNNLFHCYKVYGSINGENWEPIEVKTMDIQEADDPYWHYGYIVPKETIQKDYEYLKIAIEGTLTDDWKVQFGDVRIQDKPFDSVITKVELVNDKLKIPVGQSLSIQARILPEAVFPFKIGYEVADENIAKVDENGVVTGIKEGSTIVRIYAKDKPEVYAECMIEILPEVDNAKVIAESIKTLMIKNGKIDIPYFDGYEITIKSSSHINIINLDGVVKPNENNENVILILSVKNLKTGQIFNTDEIIVKVEGTHIHIELKPEEKANDATHKNVKTGDPKMIEFFLGTCLISVCGLILLVKRKEQK